MHHAHCDAHLIRRAWIQIIVVQISNGKHQESSTHVEGKEGEEGDWGVAL